MTVTRAGRGSGHLRRVGEPLVGRGHPAAVDEERGARRGHQRDDDVDARLPVVVGLVADDDRLAHVVGAGRRDHGVLLRRVGVPALAQHLLDRDGRRVLVGADDGVVRLLGLQPVPLPATEQQAGVGEQQDDDQEQEPASADEEPQTPHRSRLSGQGERLWAPAPRMDRVSMQRPLADAYGRVATDLRVSLTDRCNLRCSYCMPAEGLDWLPHAEVLTDDEVVRLISIAVDRLGVREVRFTGGEPLVRRGLVDIVARTRALGDDLQLSITTNALGLERNARALAAAGLDRVNISLDTIDPERFHTITRRDRLDDVLRGAKAAHDAGPAAGQDQRRPAARRQRRRRLRAARLGRRPRLRAALHRADAARRPARLAPRADGHRRRDLREARAASSPSPRPASRGGARRPSCSWSTAVRRPWA